VILASLALGSCASRPSHEIVETWEASAPDASFRILFVVCVEDDERERAELEDAVAARLEARGIQAIASHRVQPAGGLTVENLPDVVAEQGADAVLTVEVVDYDERTVVAWSPALAAGQRDARAVVEAHSAMLEIDTPKAFAQIMLWDARGWEDIWAARSDPFVPHEIGDHTAEFARIIARAVETSGHVSE